MRPSHLQRSQASALLAVYWAIAILSLAVFTTLQFLLFEVSHGNARSNRFQANQLAHSIAAIATNPAVEEDDPILSNTTSRGAQSATIISEGSRFPLNQYLNPEARHVLESLLEIWGIEGGNATTLVDQLIDWTDADNATTGQGKERGYYFSAGIPGYPFNRPFEALDELTLVADYPLLAQVKPDWRSVFTLKSSGKLDVNTASADLIAAVCECSLSTAEHFVQTRSGSDGIPLTIDDLEMETVEEALDLLMTYGTDRERVAPRFTTDDPVKRIVATGTVGDVTVEQVWIVRNRSTAPEVIDFSTRQLRHE